VLALFSGRARQGAAEEGHICLQESRREGGGGGALVIFAVILILQLSCFPRKAGIEGGGGGVLAIVLVFRSCMAPQINLGCLET